MRRLLLAIGFLAPLISVHQGQAQEKGLFFYGLQMEEFEYRRGDEDEDLIAWGGDAFVGPDELQLRWLGTGAYDTRRGGLGTL